jgi:hypothetical protein
MTAATATPAAGVTGAAVPAMGQLLLMAGRLLVGAAESVVVVMLARIWRKGPDAADGSRNGADGAKTPASG